MTQQLRVRWSCTGLEFVPSTIIEWFTTFCNSSYRECPRLTSNNMCARTQRVHTHTHTHTMWGEEIKKLNASWKTLLPEDGTGWFIYMKLQNQVWWKCSDLGWFWRRRVETHLGDTEEPSVLMAMLTVLIAVDYLVLYICPNSEKVHSSLCYFSFCKFHLKRKKEKAAMSRGEWCVHWSTKGQVYWCVQIVLEHIQEIHGQYSVLDGGEVHRWRNSR